MARIMIQCPRTDEAVWTGTSAGRQKDLDTAWAGNSFVCPACAQTHHWAAKDAYLQGE